MQTNEEKSTAVRHVLHRAKVLADKGLLRAEEVQFRDLAKAISLVDVEWLRRCHKVLDAAEKALDILEHCDPCAKCGGALMEAMDELSSAVKKGA